MGGVPSAQASATEKGRKTPAAVQDYLASHPNAYQTSTYQVAFGDGSVRMNFVPEGSDHVATPELTSALAATSYLNQCPYGNSTFWYCFYQHSNFKGRMLQFKACGPFGGVSQNLADYGFQQETSSWTNTNPNARIYVFSNPDWTQLLWIEDKGPTQSSWVGTAQTWIRE